MWSTHPFQWNMPPLQRMMVVESSAPLTTPPAASLHSWCPILFPRIRPPSWVSPLLAWVQPLIPYSPPNPVYSSREANLSTMKWRHAVRLWSRPGQSLFLPLVCQRQACSQEATGSTQSLLITVLARETAPPQGARSWRTRQRTCGTPHTAPGFWKTSGGRKHWLTLSPCHSQAHLPPPPTHRLLRPATQPQKTMRLGVTVPTALTSALLASAPPQLHPLPARLNLPRTCPLISLQQVAAQKLAWTWLSSRVSPVGMSTMPTMSKATKQRACPWLNPKPRKPSQTPALPPASPQGLAWGWR